MYSNLFNNRGSFTIELSIIVIPILFLVVLFVTSSGNVMKHIDFSTVSNDKYQEAFSEKIRDIRFEKVIKEDI
ncbi:MAG: hypothetical protein CSB16_01670 [Clostridiales bacterium]|nr:MAG: hypothetical protein CSB16_01670 [Clostridiales bacterium]